MVASNSVLIGRRDPSLNVTSLRAKQKVSEVRLNELRFTRPETAVFLQAVLGKAINEAGIATLTEKSEGWITGLRLAILSTRGQEDAIRKLLDLKGTTVHVMEYMITEVLNGVFGNRYWPANALKWFEKLEGWSVWSCPQITRR